MLDEESYKLLASTAVVIALWGGWIAALLKFLLSPLRIPKDDRLARDREQNLLAGMLLSMFGLLVGTITVYIILAIGFYRELKAKQRIAAGHPETAPASWLFPRVTAGEMIAMSLCFAMYPILIFGTEFSRETNAWLIFAMICGALQYPLYALAAFNRVNARNIPVCGWRTLYIGLFPLALFICVFQPMALLFFSGVNRGGSPFVQLGLGFLIVVIETSASIHCVRMLKREPPKVERVETSEPSSYRRHRMEQMKNPPAADDAAQNPE